MSATLALVVARGGSRGIPRKNLAPLRGKPLIAWTLAVARATAGIDRVVVSTEDEEIGRVACSHGAHAWLPRPPELARDETPTMPVLLHALEHLPDFEWVVLLQPTSPLRRTEDVEACLRLCRAHGGTPVVTVTPASPPPDHMLRLDEDGRFLPLFDRLPGSARRQDLAPVMALNGAVYAASRSWLLEHRSFVGPQTRGVVMPKARSVDIDEPLDLAIAEALLARAGPVAA